MEEKQTCTGCQVFKNISEFPNRKHNKNGKSFRCKECTNKYYQKYRDNAKNTRDEKLIKYFGYKVNMIKKQDRNKFPEYENNLTPNDLLDVFKKFDGRCVYSNKQLKIGSKVSIYAKISFDRIDNELPHTKENLQLTSVFMNMMRGCRTHEEFTDLIEKS